MTTERPPIWALATVLLISLAIIGVVGYSLIFILDWTL